MAEKSLSPLNLASWVGEMGLFAILTPPILDICDPEVPVSCSL